LLQLHNVVTGENGRSKTLSMIGSSPLLMAGRPHPEEGAERAVSKDEG